MAFPSIFTDKLGTNYAPNDQESSQIRDLLLVPSAKIAQIDLEIAALSVRRSELARLVAAHTALLSPIRRLPPDVLREIFLWCLPTSHHPTMSVRHAPLLLGRVCGLWREVALATPRLWARVHIVEPRMDTASQRLVDGCLQLTEMWLARSGVLPLEISFHRSPPRPRGPAILSQFPGGGGVVGGGGGGAGSAVKEPSAGCSVFMDTVLGVKTRWKNLVLSGCTQSPLPVSACDVPRLESLEIAEFCVTGEQPAASHAVFSAPNLRKLTLATRLDPTTLPIPWAQLTSLHLAPIYSQNLEQAWSLSSSMVIYILSMMFNLRECTLQMTLENGEMDTEESPPPVHLPLLRSLKLTLSLRGMTGRNTDPLTRLVLPGLTTFVFLGYTLNVLSFPLATSLISKSTKLSDVEIETMLFDRSSLTEFLEILPPTTKRLCMRQSVLGRGAPSSVDGDVLRLLSTPVLSPEDSSDEGDDDDDDDDDEADDDDDADGRGQSSHSVPPIPLPYLESIEFLHACDFSDDELLQFILPRVRNAPCALRRVNVVFFRLQEVDIMEPLREYVDGLGLKMKLDYIKQQSGWHPKQGLQQMGSRRPWYGTAVDLFD
ncbi:unnamed protein product [Mycena citricolor]|uniref:F-box domain-containing protein n=1 Tax=Mycena citricolor TaxID=2018698 RepID=A0AAD2JZP4_9AGAR|nr:unnamed protein product [Mycena citricolor]